MSWVDLGPRRARAWPQAARTTSSFFQSRRSVPWFSARRWHRLFPQTRMQTESLTVGKCCSRPAMPQPIWIRMDSIISPNSRTGRIRAFPTVPLWRVLSTTGISFQKPCGGIQPDRFGVMWQGSPSGGGSMARLTWRAVGRLETTDGRRARILGSMSRRRGHWKSPTTPQVGIIPL